MGSLRSSGGRQNRLQKLCDKDPSVKQALEAYVDAVRCRGEQAFSSNTYHVGKKLRLCQAMKKALVQEGKREPSATIMAQKIFAGVFDGTKQVLDAKHGLYDLEVRAQALQRQIDSRRAVVTDPMKNVFGLK